MAEQKQSCAFRTSIGGQALIEGHTQQKQQTFIKR